MAAAAIPIITTLAAGAMQFMGARKQEKALSAAAHQQELAAQEAERLGMMNAAAQEAETAEAVRRETKAADEAASLRKARAAASGGTMTGSTAAFMEEQSAREREYIAWLEKSGRSQAEIERERARYAGMEGRVAASMTRSRAAGSKWSALSGLVKSVGSAYNLYNPAG